MGCYVIIWHLPNSSSKMTADRTKTRETYKAAEREEEKLKKLRDDLLSYIGTPHAHEKELEHKRSL